MPLELAMFGLVVAFLLVSVSEHVSPICSRHAKLGAPNLGRQRTAASTPPQEPWHYIS